MRIHRGRGTMPIRSRASRFRTARRRRPRRGAARGRAGRSRAARSRATRRGAGRSTRIASRLATRLAGAVVLEQALEVAAIQLEARVAAAGVAGVTGRSTSRGARIAAMAREHAAAPIEERRGTARAAARDGGSRATGVAGARGRMRSRQQGRGQKNKSGIHQSISSVRGEPKGKAWGDCVVSTHRARRSRNIGLSKRRSPRKWIVRDGRLAPRFELAIAGRRDRNLDCGASASFSFFLKSEVASTGDWSTQARAKGSRSCRDRS